MNISYTEFTKELKDGTYTEHYPIKGNKNVVTLNYCTSKVKDFKNPYLCECRGITFNKNTGKVISRGIHKFFNVGENSLSSKVVYSNLMMKEERLIFEKLDGTMVIPFIYENVLYFKTKRVLFDEFLLLNDSNTKLKDKIKLEKLKKLEKKLVTKNIIDFSRKLLKEGTVPIFEYIGPNNKICVEYVEERFVVIGIRNLDNGAYINRNFVESICKMFSVECVKIFSTNPNDESSTKNFEGVVVFFTKQQMFFKVKTNWYRKTHLLKNFKSLEKKRHFFVNKILELKIDDYKPFLKKNENIMVMKYEELINKTIDKIMEGLKKYVEKHRTISNKKLANMIKSRVVKNVVFKIRNNVKFNPLKLYRNKEEFLELIKEI